jgi:hypothetical protein
MTASPCALQAEVTDTVTGITYYFWCDQWMDTAQGDGKTQRLLPASLQDPLSLKTTYKARGRGSCSSSHCTHPHTQLSAGWWRVPLTLSQQCLACWASQGDPLTRRTQLLFCLTTAPDKIVRSHYTKPEAVEKPTSGLSQAAVFMHTGVRVHERQARR